jgi:SAM-dependent methyltransferase
VSAAGVRYLPNDLSPERRAALEREIARLGAESPYGWGHTLDLGAGLRIDGLLAENYRQIVADWRRLGWLPQDLTGARVADVGGWNGGITIDLIAHGASVVNVEEIPSHARQFAFVRDTLQLPRASLVVDTMYRMPWFPETRDLDLIVCSGVLYHLSDMIVGLKTLYDCLRAPGTLLMESQVAPEADLPYAYFGRFVSGMWWEPSPGCVREMLEFVGFDEVAWEPHSFTQRALFRAHKRTPRQMPFKRGLNYPFADILDARQRDFTRLRPDDDTTTPG